MRDSLVVSSSRHSGLCDGVGLLIGINVDEIGVSIANGGGTISDMFEPSERAGIFGYVFGLL